MRRETAILLTLGVVGAAGLLGGCNERLDDPTTSEGILSIEKVEPVNVQADRTPTDPNGNPQTLSSDSVNITVKNRLRNPSAGQFADVYLSKSELFCNRISPTKASNVLVRTGPVAATVTAGQSVAVSVVVVTVSDKTGGAATNDSWRCFVRLEGEDLAGNPATTEFASFVVDFVDG